MAVVTFDTLKFVETLEKEGFERKQASAIAHAVRDSQDAADVATKADVRELESSTDSKFELLRKDIDLVRKEIAIARRDTIIWLGGISIAGFVTLGGLLLAAWRLLPPPH